MPQTIIKGYLIQTAHQKHDDTLVDFKRFCLKELAELTWAGLFEAGLLGNPGLVRNLNYRISGLKKQVHFNSFCLQFDDRIL